LRVPDRRGWRRGGDGTRLGTKTFSTCPADFTGSKNEGYSRVAFARGCCKRNPFEIQGGPRGPSLGSAVCLDLPAAISGVRMVAASGEPKNEEGATGNRKEYHRIWGHRLAVAPSKQKLISDHLPLPTLIERETTPVTPLAKKKTWISDPRAWRDRGPHFYDEKPVLHLSFCPHGESQPPSPTATARTDPWRRHDTWDDSLAHTSGNYRSGDFGFGAALAIMLKYWFLSENNIFRWIFWNFFSRFQCWPRDHVGCGTEKKK